MDPSGEGSAAAPPATTPTVPRSGISRVARKNMQEGKAQAGQKRQRQKDTLAEARRAALASRHKTRSHKSTMRSLAAALPVVHEKYHDITEDMSMEVLRIMHVVYEAMAGDPKWYPRAVQAASTSTGIGHMLIRRIFSHYETTNSFYQTARVEVPSTSDLDDAARDWLEFEPARLKRCGTMKTIAGLQQMLEAKFSRPFTRYGVEQLMRSMGFVYGRVSVDWTLGMSSPRRQRQLMLHLLMLDVAIAEANAGNAILLFTDQTFIDTRTHIRMGWHKPGEGGGKFPKGTGDRVAHMHALTEFGLLTFTDSDDIPVETPASDGVKGTRASEDALTAELTFYLQPKKGAAKKEDGRKEEKPGFNAQVCSDWVTHRLLLTARKIWPLKRLYLYMDNFSGHTGRDATVFWPTSAQSREVLLKGLLASGCESVTHDGNVFSIAAWLAELAAPKPLPGQKKKKRVGPKPPNVPQLIALGREWMWTHKPDSAYSQVQRAAMADGNCVIIYSVPLTPNANPIEYWWGTAKGDLGRLYDGTTDGITITRRWRDIAIDREMIMKGAKADRIAVEPSSLCRKYVNAALTWAQVNLVPVSALAACGELGEFKLSKCPEADPLRTLISSDAKVYYRLWKDTDDLSLAVPDAVELDEEDDEVDPDGADD